VNVRELLRREPDPAEYREIRELWKAHSIAEDARDIPGLLATLTDDCVYEVVPTGTVWRGHAGATDFDIHFDLTQIVIGPQGVCEEARVTGTRRGDWLGYAATGDAVEFNVVIFFPWDPERKLFRGERVHFDSGRVFGGR
jgi:hypothetical protein